MLLKKNMTEVRNLHPRFMLKLDVKILTVP